MTIFMSVFVCVCELKFECNLVIVILSLFPLKILLFGLYMSRVRSNIVNVSSSFKYNGRLPPGIIYKPREQFLDVYEPHPPRNLCTILLIKAFEVVFDNPLLFLSPSMFTWFMDDPPGRIRYFVHDKISKALIFRKTHKSQGR